MAENNETIASQFKKEHSGDQAVLDMAKECAKLTLPHLLQDETAEPNADTDPNFQSVGATGLQAFTAQLALACFPSAPWFSFSPSPEILYSPKINEEEKQLFDASLFKRQLAIQAIIESAGRKVRAGKGRAGRRRPGGFHSHKHSVLRYVVCTGDALERMDDDYRLVSFSRNDYVTRRDSAGDVLHHITREKLDALSLPKEMHSAIDKDKLDPEKLAGDRMVDLYTRCRWEPLSKRWLVQQEVEDEIVVEFDEEISRFFATPFDLSGSDHYGRGLVEQNIGDLRSLDNIAERLLDFLAAASKYFYAVDEDSDVTQNDLNKAAGSVIRCSVKGGQVQDVAMLGLSMPRENALLLNSLNMYKDRLGRAFMDESQAQPTGERVTATQIARIAEEMQGRRGNATASIVDHQQIPLIERAEFMAMRDNLIDDEVPEAYDISTHSGFDALAKFRKSSDLLDIGTLAAQMGPAALAKIDQGVLVDLVARYRGVYEPGLIKTNEQLASEQQQQMQQGLEAAAGEKAIDVLGNAAEQTLTGEQQ